MQSGEERDSALVAPWGLSEGVGGLLLAFVLYFIGAATFFAAEGGLDRRDHLAFQLVSYQFLVISVAIVAIMVILLRYGLAPRALGFRVPGWKKLLVTIVLIPGTFLAEGILYMLFTKLLPGYHLQGNARSTLLTRHERVGLVEQVLAGIWVSIEVPLTEETLFRGILYQGLRHFFQRRLPYRWSVGCAAVVSGLAFGFAHFEPHTLPVLVFLGIVLALVFQYTRSIYASALIHGATNLIALISVFNS